MTPMLGIMASAVSGNLWAPGKDFDSIATTTVGAGGAATISFTSIPATYKHLQIRYLAKTNRATYGVDDAFITLNSDVTGANYYSHWIYGTGSSALATYGVGNGGGGQGIFWGFAFSTTQISPTGFAGGVIDVLDYANTNKNKTLRGLMGFDANGGTAGGYGGTVTFASGAWFSTSATNNITIKSNGSFQEYSQFALYGVK
jgi:hypothetical protein